MDALVTGGTGFVGANLVRELLADGRSVRVLARKGSDRRALEGCAVEIAEGDLLDPDSLRAAVKGARHVYHVAADYRLWARDPRELYRANVDGTRHVLTAAAEAGAERGRIGQKYVLGHRNMPLIEIFRALAAITGVRAPRFQVPYGVAWLAALCMEGAARVTGGTPQVPLTAVRMSRKRMYFSAEKAVRELGLPQTPVEGALRDAVAWFVERGYAPRPAGLRAA